MTAKTPEVAASNAQAAGDASQDALAIYKKKLFYRRLKVIVIGFIALALLLSGCLLGFVLPASIHEDANANNDRSESKTNKLVGINNESLPDANTTTGPITNLTASTVILPNTTKLSNLSSTTTKPLSTRRTTTSTRPTTQRSTDAITKPELPTTSVSRKHTTSKWWVVKFQDHISGVKWKHAPRRTTTTTTTQAPIRTTTPDSPVYKWWLIHWKEHVENAIQKNQMRDNNNATRSEPRAESALVQNGGGVKQVESTSGTWDDVKNQLTGYLFKSNQTGQSNVRSVTSYAKQNFTTTMASVVTRKVEVEK